MPRQGLSIRKYAAHRGCDEKSVRNAIRDGRIAAAVFPDKSIDPDKADRLWEENTSPHQRRGAEAERGQKILSGGGRDWTFADADNADNFCGDAESVGEQEFADGRKLTKADYGVLIERERHRKMKLANDMAEGMLVDAAASKAHFFRVLKSLKDSVEVWPEGAGARMAGKFGLGVHDATQFLRDEVRSLLITMSKQEAREGAGVVKDIGHDAPEVGDVD